MFNKVLRFSCIFNEKRIIERYVEIENVNYHTFLQVLQHPQFFELSSCENEFEIIEYILQYIELKSLNQDEIAMLFSVCEFRHLSLTRLNDLKKHNIIPKYLIDSAIEYYHKLKDYLNGDIPTIDYKPTVSIAIKRRLILKGSFQI